MTEVDSSREVMFYHLQRQSLDDVLPGLLEKTLARGWRAVVQAATRERLDALDLLLWTYRDDSFLPHGTAREGNAEHQPIYLTLDDATPNGAGVRFLIETAEPADFSSHARFVFLFDGNDEAQLAHARAQWQAAKAAGCKVSYWRQGENGKWENKA